MLDLKQEFRANRQDPASTQRPSRDEPWPLHTDRDRKGTEALACDNCDKWCHLSCMVMTSAEYNHLENSSTSWICSSCNSPNYTKIFDSITAVSNSFESLSLELTSDSLHTGSFTVGSPSSSFGNLKATYSTIKPRQNPGKLKISSLRTFVVNFQSIKKHRY